MTPSYFLGLDVAKQKVRAALRGPDERFLCERSLPVTPTIAAEAIIAPTNSTSVIRAGI